MARIREQVDIRVPPDNRPLKDGGMLSGDMWPGVGIYSP